MRFETDVLTYQPEYEEFAGRQTRDYLTSNVACREDLNADWIIPRRGKLVLVFSTLPVVGATKCLAGSLRRAGRIALQKAASEYCHGLAGEWRLPGGSLLHGYEPLWWWPEIVTEGK